MQLWLQDSLEVRELEPQEAPAKVLCERLREETGAEKWVKEELSR